MNNEYEYPKEILSLPIAPYLDEIANTLKKASSHFLILTAETAAGKSTAIPFALLHHFCSEKNSRGIVMLEPRRLAVLNIASRVAELLGEQTGETCGYQMHLESRVSSKTKCTVLTEAILTRRLQDDPSLEDVSVVVIDEFHERSIHADLALAFLKEAMALRNDLYVVVMSATIDTEKISSYLNAPVFCVPGRLFPVAVSYAGAIKPSQAIVTELKNKNESGSILVFLPGIRDIHQTQAELESISIDADICILHSSVSFAEQKKVLIGTQGNVARRRVILSSAIAETSLTVPDVTVVIDSGLSRINKYNRSAGMETLVTRNESVFNAQQRAGRAGRVAPGRCICLWNESDVRSSESAPEILRTDLTSLVLECAEWGVDSPQKIEWLDEPSEASWSQAQNLLLQLGCVEKSGDNYKITSLGKAVLTLGVHPRLACVAMSGLLFAKENGCDEKETSRVMEIALEQAVKYSPYAEGSFGQQKLFAQDLSRRVTKAAAVMCFGKRDTGCEGIFSESSALLAGYPDRIAVKVHDTTYQFPSGRMAQINENTEFYPQYLIAPQVDAGERTGRIYAWEPIQNEQAELWLVSHAETNIVTKFQEEPDNATKLEKTEITAYGKIILKKCKLVPEQNDYAQAVCTIVAEKGITWLPLNLSSKNLLLRVQFYLAHSTSKEIEKEDSLASKYKNLALSADKWLLSFISTTNKVTDEMVYNALYWYLDGAEINKSVPMELKLSNGKVRKLVYENQNGCIVPVLEIIIQQIFGCMETPKVMGVPVLLKLLSPARRPLQITNDLENFWLTTWPEIGKEMRGRYPKHNWDYRVVTD